MISAKVVTQINDVEGLSVHGFINKDTPELGRKMCKHCGSKNHSLFQIHYEEGQIISVSARCPLITELRFREIEPKEEIAYRYEFSPDTVAKHARYKTHMVEDILAKMRKKGFGKELSKEVLRKFRARTINQCMETITDIKHSRFQETHFQPKCLCCGSVEHALLHKVEDQYEYLCPLTQCKTWTPTVNKLNRYWISIPDLVQQCKGNVGTIEEALAQYRKEGAGRWLSSKQYHHFWENVFNYTLTLSDADNTRGDSDEEDPEEAFIVPRSDIGTFNQEATTNKLPTEVWSQGKKDMNTLALTLLSIVWMYIIRCTKWNNRMTRC